MADKDYMDRTINASIKAVSTEGSELHVQNGTSAFPAGGKLTATYPIEIAVSQSQSGG